MARISHNSHNSKLKNSLDHFSGPDLKIFVKDVDDTNGRKRALTVKTWSTIKDVKDQVQKLLHVPPSFQRLYFGPILSTGSDLPNHRTLHDAGIYRSGETLYLEIKKTDPSSSLSDGSISSLMAGGANDICVSKSLLDLTPKPLKRLVQQARRGLALGLKPDLVLDGSGGTYFLHDARKVRVAVFKPSDEEPYAENNPRGYVPQGRVSDFDCSLEGPESMSMRAGIKPGEACLREVAAYLLDHDSFADVPMTSLAEARHPAFHCNGSMLNLNQGGASVGSHSLTNLTSSHSPSMRQPPKKIGSCQEFVHAECTMDDLSPSKINIDELHKIAVLDIRLMNADRNTANLLCRRNPEDPDDIKLIPIDHGYCLRTAADVCWFDWCWLDWPQMKQPVSAKTKEYILKLDIEADALLLKERLQIPERALDYFRLSSKLLQEGIRSGLTLYDIAVLCCRNDDSGELPSKLESLMSMADEIAKYAVDNGRWHHTAASRALEQQLSSQFSPQHGLDRISKKSEGTIMMGIFKSHSSLNFSSLIGGSRTTEFNDAPKIMSPSSGSDTGPDDGDDDPASIGEAECEEWAASLIAEALEQSPSHRHRSGSARQRAISFARTDSSHSLSSSGDIVDCESDQLSSSPIGFWHVPPSVSKKNLDDSKSSWSPFTSPVPSPIVNPVGKDVDKLKIVKFNMESLVPPLAPSLHVSESKADPVDTKQINVKPPMLSGFGFRRSQSYSAFSFTRITDDDDSKDVNFGHRITSLDISDQQRRYFLKFIDLLVYREITRKIRAQGCSHTS